MTVGMEESNIIEWTRSTHLKYYPGMTNTPGLMMVWMTEQWQALAQTGISGIHHS